MSIATNLVIRPIGADQIAMHIDALAKILRDCVHDGASVGFVLPFEMAQARSFYADAVVPSLGAGRRILLGAWNDGALVGTGQLNLDTMPNQRHRADVMKVLVHPACQRRGFGRALMKELERIARSRDRTLLTLDTIAGDKAEPLYLSLGYEIAGRIPSYARAALRDELETTSVMFKLLRPHA